MTMKVSFLFKKNAKEILADIKEDTDKEIRKNVCLVSPLTQFFKSVPASWNGSATKSKSPNESLMDKHKRFEPKSL